MPLKITTLFITIAILLGGCRSSIEETVVQDDKDTQLAAETVADKEIPVPENADKTSPSSDRVQMVTSMGTILIELEPEAAPVTVANFLEYVNSGHFAGTIFHRVIPGFVIQGGGLDQNLTPKPTRPPIVNESNNGLKNLRGTLSMARTNDLNSATCQFFINLSDNAALDYPTNGGYAVFGRVVEGIDVVDRIAAVPTGINRGMRDVPLKTVRIESASLVQ